MPFPLLSFCAPFVRPSSIPPPPSRNHVTPRLIDLFVPLTIFGQPSRHSPLPCSARLSKLLSSLSLPSWLSFFDLPPPTIGYCFGPFVDASRNRFPTHPLIFLTYRLRLFSPPFARAPFSVTQNDQNHPFSFGCRTWLSPTLYFRFSPQVYGILCFGIFFYLSLLSLSCRDMPPSIPSPFVTF